MPCAREARGLRARPSSALPTARMPLTAAAAARLRPPLMAHPSWPGRPGSSAQHGESAFLCRGPARALLVTPGRHAASAWRALSRSGTPLAEVMQKRQSCDAHDDMMHAPKTWPTPHPASPLPYQRVILLLLTLLPHRCTSHYQVPFAWQGKPSWRRHR